VTVSPGNLDSLLNEAFPDADFTSVSFQSETGAGFSVASLGYTYSTVTLDATGVPGPGTLAAETLKVVGVNDPQNSITLSLSVGGSPLLQFTEYVDGYSPNSLLISQLSTSGVAGFAATAPSELNSVVGVLSSSPIPAGTSITFTQSGSSSLTSTPAPVTPTPGFAVLDTTTGQPVSATAQPYTGPVSGLTSEYINVTSDSLNITANTPNWFIHSGSGNDAIAVSSGTNVLDGGTGSNFLTGGSGTDTFFVDDRGPTSDIWSTVNNFHAGDAATIWGVTSGDFNLSWVDGQGAAGYTGLTLHATAAGVPTASLTLAGFTSTDLNDGRLSVSFGTSGGSHYMYVQANS
jgi:hypothetical protein